MRDRLDRYYTPKGLARDLVGLLPSLDGARALEPSAGGGAFVAALQHAGAHVTALDVDPSAAGLSLAQDGRVCAFEGHQEPADIVVGNPPYRLALGHVVHALALSRRVAFLLRLAFLESRGRAALWRAHPCKTVWALTSRPSFTGQGTDNSAYGFFYWDLDYQGPTELRVYDGMHAPGGRLWAPNAA